MIHFGIISPPVSGHIHPFSALGRELLARGHRVTYFQVTDLEQKIRSEGLDFWPVGELDHPPGSLPRSLAELGGLQGLAALRFTIRAVARTTEMLCRDLPQAIRATGVEALLVDQMEPAGGSVAEHLGIPFITICNALVINRDPIAPPPFSPWTYHDRWWARWRNRMGYLVSDWLTRAITDVVATYRSRWKLPRLASADQTFSPLAQISQMPGAFDFPRSDLPGTFHYVGPLRRDRPAPTTFPWDRLDGRPVIYASLGTLQNSREPLFQCFAEAARGLEMQVVVSHGGGLTRDQADRLLGDPLVVDYAPQLDLLSHARLTITHAGLNTVLDSLTNGVPLVAVPITYEQPAIARRVEWTGSGRVVSLRGLHAGALRKAVTAVLEEARYIEGARRIKESIREAGGVTRAADIVEGVLA